MLDLDYEQVSSLLSELSQPSAVPRLDGNVKVPRPFEANEVSFESSAWLARIIEIAIWLNLDSSFKVSDTPENVALRLFDELSQNDATSCYRIVDGRVELTEAGAQALEFLLSRASSNRTAFLQSIENGRSVEVATETWLEAWNEQAVDEPLSINASVDKWRINDLAGYASQNKLDLNPTYQRDFIWSNSDSQLLIESILRGIPLPSIILARGSNSQSFQIVDGKQRLTAILRFMGSHPEGLQHAKQLKDFDESFKTNFGQFVRRNSLKAAEIREKYLPFKTKKFGPEDPLSRLGGRYYCEIRDENVKIAGETITVADLFERPSEYFIPVLIYKDTQVRDIHRVFRLYNQQGMKLNAEEIRNAVFNHLLISRAMLFISGDRIEETIAPELVKANIDPTEAHEIINALGFSVSRFRRTKILFWTIATLILKPTQGQDAAFRTPSTASHIDEFLRSIDDGRLGQFKSLGTLEILARDLIAALELHQMASDAWHPKFRRKGKSEMASRWEELPVVASLLACMVLVVMDKQKLLLDKIDQIHHQTAGMVGPSSTQNKTQWAHIAKSSTTVLELLGIEINDAHIAIKERYGDSALDALVEIRKISL